MTTIKQRKKLLETITKVVAEEYRGFKKDQNFKLTDKEIDPETGSITTSVKYLPKFNEIRRTITGYVAKIHTLATHSDENIAAHAINAERRLKEANAAVHKLQQAMDVEKNINRYF